MTLVSVRGEVTREVDPEIATLGVTVASRDRQRSTALAQLADRVERLRSLIDGYGDAIERRESSSVFVYPETKRRGESVSAYTGSVSTQVTVRDFAVLGDLVIALADQDQTYVNGPWWALRPDSPAYAAARRDAIGEAIARARTYAEALGSRLVRLVELADDGLDGTGPQTFALAAAPGGSRSGGVELHLDPQKQTVNARILARFEISEPTVLG